MRHLYLSAVLSAYVLPPPSPRAPSPSLSCAFPLSLLSAQRRMNSSRKASTCAHSWRVSFPSAARAAAGRSGPKRLTSVAAASLPASGSLSKATLSSYSSGSLWLATWT